MTRETKTQIQRLTLEQIMEAQTPNGGWTKAALAKWGVPWPPPKGWKKKLIEKVSDE
ncbi:MAG: hypothetical protein AAGG68_17335 [Bacteroidota bacterium]